MTSPPRKHLCHGNRSCSNKTHTGYGPAARRPPQPFQSLLTSSLLTSPTLTSSLLMCLRRLKCSESDGQRFSQVMTSSCSRSDKRSLAKRAKNGEVLESLTISEDLTTSAGHSTTVNVRIRVQVQGQRHYRRPQLRLRLAKGPQQHVNEIGHCCFSPAPYLESVVHIGTSNTGEGQLGRGLF